MPTADPSQEMLTEIEVLWITAGLGCDGDTIAMTGATQPSLEDLVQGALPGVPRMKLRNPVLAYEVGDDFLRHFELAAAGQLDPFILVIDDTPAIHEDFCEMALVPFRVTQVFVLHLCYFLNQEDLMEREAMVQNP